MKKRGNKAQSQIVSTVILILIGVIAAGLIIGYVVPFVKTRLSEGDCLDVLGRVTISTGYTCHDDKSEPATENRTLIQVHIAEIRNLIDGFAIELGGPSSKTTKIIEANFPADFKMYDSDTFELPNDNEERTYNITTASKPNYITVYPILKGGKSCGESDSINEVKDC